MGTTAREDISTTKKDLISSKGVVFAPRTIQFAHQFVGSETSLNMLSLTTPSLLSGNGFVNASPQEIAGANLSVFGKNLKLSLSRGLELKPYVHYLIANNNIVFIGSLKDNGGALTDEILFGEIQMAAGNAQIVGDVRFVRGTVEVAVGQTLVNLGERFKVNENPASQIGDVKIKRNGVGIYRNVGNATASLSADGNYQEMDSGTGYGVSITLNEPPIGQADLIEYEIGVQLSSGDLALWDQFQRLQGSILALSQDAAEGFYGDTDYSRYLSVSPSDLDRKAFGDLVVAMSARVAAIETTISTRVAVVANKISGTFSAGANVSAFTNVLKNVGGAWNNTTGEFTVPLPGDYQVDLVFESSTANNVSKIYRTRLGVTTTFYNGDGFASNGFHGVHGLVVDCLVGDIIFIRPVSAATLSAFAEGNVLSIYRVF